VDDYLTIKELAAKIRMSHHTIRKWVMANEIPHKKIRKTVRFQATEIEAWIKNGGLSLFGDNEGNAAGNGDTEHDGD